MRPGHYPLSEFLADLSAALIVEGALWATREVSRDRETTPLEKRAATALIELMGLAAANVFAGQRGEATFKREFHSHRRFLP